MKNKKLYLSCVLKRRKDFAGIITTFRVDTVIEDSMIKGDFQMT